MPPWEARILEEFVERERAAGNSDRWIAGSARYWDDMYYIDPGFNRFIASLMDDEFRYRWGPA